MCVGMLRINALDKHYKKARAKRQLLMIHEQNRPNIAIVLKKLELMYLCST